MCSIVLDARCEYMNSTCFNSELKKKSTRDKIEDSTQNSLTNSRPAELQERGEKENQILLELQPPPLTLIARYKIKVLTAQKAYFVRYCASAWNGAC